MWKKEQEEEDEEEESAPGGSRRTMESEGSDKGQDILTVPRHGPRTAANTSLGSAAAVNQLRAANFRNLSTSSGRETLLP